MRQVDREEAQTRLFDLIDAAIGGEAVFIVGPDQRVVRLVPVRSLPPRRQFGSAHGLIMMAEDFDDPLPGFDEYTW